MLSHAVLDFSRSSRTKTRNQPGFRFARFRVFGEYDEHEEPVDASCSISLDLLASAEIRCRIPCHLKFIQIQALYRKTENGTNETRRENTGDQGLRRCESRAGSKGHHRRPEGP